MAILYVTEYADASRSGMIQVAAEPENASQTVAIGGSSTASSAFANNTQLVRLETDATCSVKFGTAPTATATNRRMQAGDIEYFSIPVSSAYKVAVITNS